MKAIVFPGQGSQAQGMGRDLFSRYPGPTRDASDILGYSIASLCLEDPDGRLSDTRYTQPAIFVVNALSYMDYVAGGGTPPAYLAGHSLGEFNALLAAGVFDFPTGVAIVKKRAELMASCKNGGMAAIIGLSEGEIKAILADQGLGDLYVANLNTPQQVVIAGSKDHIKSAEGVFEGRARLFVTLKVSGAFHSPFMGQAHGAFKAFLEAQELHPPAIAVMANLSARPYGRDIHELIADQMISPVKWCESVQYLIAKGVTEFTELGHGRVLSPMIAQIRESAPPLHLPDESSPSIAPPLNVPTSLNVPASVHADKLGSSNFRERYGVRYAYYAGSMYKGIASPELVIKMSRAGLLAFLGTGGQDLDQVAHDIARIKSQLGAVGFGVNLLAQPGRPELEEALVDLILAEHIAFVECSAFIQPTPGLVRLRLKGVRQDASGRPQPARQLIVKLSRPEVAEMFLSPPPAAMVKHLLALGQLTPEEAALAPSMSLASDLCVEADSAGHTDGRVTATLLPVALALRDEYQNRYGYQDAINIGSAGGIGTPAAAGAAFLMGADFVVTGSINQCTVESGASDTMKDLLQGMAVQDTAYAPAGDLFETGAKIQVLRKGVFFPARATRLYDLYRQLSSLDDLDGATRRQLENSYFGRSLAEIWQETSAYYQRAKPDELAKAEERPKHKMALVFKWYFVHTTRLALAGDREHKVNFQIHCGPALGAFNQWVKGSAMESWRQRSVTDVAEYLMQATAEYLSRQMRRLTHL